MGEGESSSIVDAELTSGETSSRARWSNQLEFTVTIIGYAVGLGNFWRFPYLCYKHGGGAFLVPYSLSLFLIAIPIFLLELAMGQKTQRGARELWVEVHPALGGVGIAGVLATFVVALYYNVIVAWALWYLGNSFSSPLPWADERGGARYFWEARVQTLRCRPDNSLGLPTDLSSGLGGAAAALLNSTANTTEASCSWAGATFPQHPGLEDSGGLVPPLLGCLAAGWFLIWVCVCKGIASIGKVAWFTALFPYVVLFILLVRGLTLEGASTGLRYYLTPDFSKLTDGKVWIAAASQIFYSTGIGWGTLIAFASYNAPSHNFVRDAWLVPLINCGTSFLAGLVVFSVLGYLANLRGVEVDELKMDGSGLAFVVYPEAIARMPGAPVFAVLFFTMLLCLGVDSQFAMVETVLTTIHDAKLLPWGKPLTSALVCALMGLCGVIFVTRAGLHWLELFDSFAVNLTLFLVGGLECLAIGWVYGADRFAADVLQMTGFRVPKAALWGYKLFIPACLLLIIAESLRGAISNGYDFPGWGVAVGWLLALASSLPIFVCALLALCRAPRRGMPKEFSAEIQVVSSTCTSRGRVHSQDSGTCTIEMSAAWQA
ncbi:hypothetical protein AB1Y20_012383 [Prymnesium parvum]|uniref:Transporter n=1 Tax=Prymnesium parvum TaxID=97485 RepID=A0AB34INY8_PRYPA